MISLAKARIIAEATAVLDDERAAAAETLIASDLAGKTPGQIAAMIGRAVVTVGYWPGALLRHLVEVRDGQCTQPTCVRAARRCDFEHAPALGEGRQNLHLQRRLSLPPRSPGKAEPGLESRTTPWRPTPVDHAKREDLYQ